MREANFNAELVRSLKRHGAWAYKIPDSPVSRMTFRTQFTPEKPCDILAIHRGRGIAIESKQIKKFEAFNAMTALRPNQIKALDEVLVTGRGRAFVFLNIRIKAVKGEVKQENRVLIFDWKEWRGVFESGSIKQKDLIALPFISGKSVRKNPQQKDTEIQYDLTEFLENISNG
jgi:hypothetical protein